MNPAKLEGYLYRVANSIYQRELPALKNNHLFSEDSLDSLVENSFFPLTRGENPDKAEGYIKLRERITNVQHHEQIPDIQFNHTVPFLEEVLLPESRPVLITGRKVYSLGPKLKFLGDLEKFENAYKELLSKKLRVKINNEALPHLTNAVYESVSLELEKEAKSEQHLSSGFDAEKVSENEYVLVREIGEYGVEWKGEFYLFPPTRIGLEFTKTDKRYNIGSMAFMYKKPEYKHPYLQGRYGEDKRVICTANMLNLIHSKINFVSSSDGPENITALMKSAINLLYRFERIITSGFNSEHTPFYSIEDSARLLAPNEVQECKSRGVKFYKKIA